MVKVLALVIILVTRNQTMNESSACDIEIERPCLANASNDSSLFDEIVQCLQRSEHFVANVDGGKDDPSTSSSLV